ncbi:MAG: VCBS repeat-containing protein [Chitinophagaceae bacterium]|jgi:hypothetical protein|nr:VCBS repeat-containing protein [Chitinophagaceae bacterium]
MQRRNFAIVISVLAIPFLLQLISCKEKIVKNKSHQQVEDGQILQGKKMAAQYCASCHALPDPSLLNSETWENQTLPAMGPRLGIFTHIFTSYPSSRGDRNLPENYYPSQPVLTVAQWQSIIDYYTSVSPDTLPKQNRTDAIHTNDSLFGVLVPSANWNTPATCFVFYDTVSKQIITSDIHTQNLYAYDTALNLKDSLRFSGAIVDMAKDSGGFAACNIGIFVPTNAKAGSIEQLYIGKGQLKKDSVPLFAGLMRPVNIKTADLNNDGRQDILICEFGYLKGALSWLENKGAHRYERHEIISLPGAIKTWVYDYNRDGLPDIWTLFAQGEEGIYLSVNKGNGQFESKEILRFPPSYGSTSFELVDMNKDGFPDIVYTCGDNADYSTILKPYHGVYIFLNDGKYNFTQKYFFPVNGCYKAIARDFDGDGNIDIATISYFADYATQPEEGFVFLKNTGNLHLTPYSLPATQAGRWIAMDAADIDNNNKPDLILANCSVGPTINKSKTDWKTGPNIMLLRQK